VTLAALAVATLSSGGLAVATVVCLAQPPKAPSLRVAWGEVLRQSDAWYGSAEARAIADRVAAYQRDDGGWPKNVDMTVPPDAGSVAAVREADSTIDNGATVTQIRLLARVFSAVGDPAYRQAALRGVSYLLAAQYPNGGWPQIFPLRGDYSRHITFNDDAMVGVLTLLAEIAEARVPFALVEEADRRRARAAVTRGIDLILRAQIRVDGRLTAWCAQHDEVTLLPAGARSYEHPSLSGQETVGIVRFLMRFGGAAPNVREAIEAAVTWLERVRLDGQRLDRREDPTLAGGFDVVLVRDPAAPPLWARFYEIGTNRPIFSGRDGVVRYSLSEIEHERRTGYSWFGQWPRALLEREYPAWQKVQKREEGQVLNCHFLHDLTPLVSRLGRPSALQDPARPAVTILLTVL
jgi:PelA/Pel-15E family pectate lyase